MTSLSEVYDGGVGSVVDRRQRILGLTVFGIGATMVVGAIPVATTALGSWLGLDVFAARRAGGILAGLGLPAVFVGIFTVLPAGRVTRAAATIGASLAVLGVALFSHAYPYQWMSANPELAIMTTALYSLGALITFWCLFVGVATFKTRTDPGGAARLELTEEGKIEVVSTEGSVPSFGSVGLFGNGPEPEAETQTGPDSGEEMLVPEPTSDGGSAVASPDGPEPVDAAMERGSPDEYCGNCSHFEYVRADGEITPYCGFHDELMEDMDACDQWESNS